ncbi:hypothetical protein CCR94_20725 [Rhodoblastus sphagnicola]|uniref:histidine kinase n=1 Tax=Rhodoblastus sphagnicola TaxID=333368 RepID=A0A2S6MY23_9HYPH|nr:PAS domain-containing sensor histidine kinase [Rhodoblastus sphagnicola]MBB4198117.1 PAS domain S-box-containing protein [Rhodoblastus sphagnicola]PPQ27256.1 hypothetical protein CCR94_20725 [Rhodoblastus sphagnicola]
MNAHFPPSGTAVPPPETAGAAKGGVLAGLKAPLAKRAGLTLIRWREQVPTWFCVVAGVAIAIMAWAARIAIFGDSAKIPYITFVPVVTLAALSGLPALGATTALACAALVLEFVAPPQGGDDIVALAIFILNSILTVALVEALMRVWSESLAQMARAQALEQLKSAIVDSSDDAIITKTLDGRIASWNPAATRILGYRPEEIIGQPVTRLFPSHLLAEESAIVAQLRASEDARHYRTQRLARDGRAIDVALTISPLRDVDGRLIGASKILRDITRQTEIDDALRASEERLRFALEGARAAAWQWDCRAMVSNWDPHFFALHGLDPARESPSFAKWMETVHEDDRAQAESAVRESLAPGAPDYHSEYRVRAPDGALRWIEIFGRVERDENGAPVRLSGISLDVSERHAAWEAAEAANNELARANDSLKRFSYIAAHDLQEPLRKIQQFSELLVTDCGGDIGDDATYYLKVLRESAERLRILINELLIFAQAANRELATAPFDANALMGRVVKTCAVAIAEARARVRIAPLPPLRGDETLVEQLFVNLLTNAIKYRRPGVTPEITLTAGEDEGRMVLRFSDNGMGIAREDQARIFEPFVRLRRGDGVKGAGIGLAICATICDRHGWRISLESAPGAGTTFCVAIPADPRHAA